jgi:BirA family biotin operon repressor/biotin-[acetyl-CoA-carboxylase] ligase
MAVSTQSNLIHPALLVRLADGELHSGEDLAVDLGVSRAAIWKGVEKLRAEGIGVLSQARRGYRLAEAVDLLDAASIRAAIDARRGAHLRTLQVLFTVDSTNTRLLAAAPPPFATADVCLCEIQSAGRGRRGRRWIAPFGSSIALSLAWTFPDTVRNLPALSLAVGVAVSRALERLGAVGIALKWPNDIWFQDRKVGGVLIELRAEAGGPAFVVIGIGLNVAPSPAARREFEQMGVRAAAIADACARPPLRNATVGVLLDELLSMLLRFERDGFAPYRDAWAGLDALRNRPVQLLIGERAIAGIARGVDEDGALLLDADGRTAKFVSGEVSLRLTADAVDT